MGIGSSWGALSGMFQGGVSDKNKKIRKKNRWEADKAALKEPICPRCTARHAKEC